MVSQNNRYGRNHMGTATGKRTPAWLSKIGPGSDRRWRTVYDRLKISFLIFIIYLILNLVGFGCPIRALSGLSCPGCGMTRATLSVIRLDFKDAFYYHPLFFLPPFMFILFLFEDFIKPKYYKAAWTVILVLFLVTYFYRLLFTGSDVVKIDISSGLVLKLLHYII